MFVTENQNITVFLADTSDELRPIRQMLSAILQYAGMKIVENTGNNVRDILKKTDCSIHIIGSSYLESAEQQLAIAREYNLENTNYKIFIWQPIDKKTVINDKRQEKFVNNIRNNLFRNMIYANHASPVMFTEDIRAIMHSEKQTKYDIKATEIFFIHNELDEDAVKNIVQLLDDVASLQLLNIILSANTDYSELASQQIAKSGLTVIYFKRSHKWAIPFAQQIWKKIGGASANANILLIADGGHEQNQSINFSAPNVTFLAVPDELIPLEIKVHYDKISEAKNEQN